MKELVIQIKIVPTCVGERVAYIYRSWVAYLYIKYTREWEYLLVKQKVNRNYHHTKIYNSTRIQ